MPSSLSVSSCAKYFCGVSSACTLSMSSQLPPILSAEGVELFGRSKEDLVQVALNIFESSFASALYRRLHLNRSTLLNFLSTMSMHYYDVPYHNFTHAVDVLQFAASLATRPEARHVLSDLDIFCLLVACVGHDAEHEGVTNDFLVCTKSQRAVIYESRAINESHHAATTLHVILNSSGCNVFEGLSEAECESALATIRDLILCTDMASHKDFVQELVHHGDYLDPSSKYDRTLLMRAIIKCSDIGNLARPVSIATEWGQLVKEEFCTQGDLERGLGLPVSFDRSSYDFTKCTVNFLKFVVLPLFQLVARTIPSVSIYVDSLSRNARIFANLRLHRKPISFPSPNLSHCYQPKANDASLFHLAAATSILV
eukprot:TRINITY_DN8546_c0_g1::TRINITY_DN8546_c0_g1_i1::g.8577::m.8577 TRINITY_DN8546_c0_g1::TRINITY_DN8546_c0_g1_i1::g.8577  ORF type:complete len:370 (+),score=41.20,sp/Q23917/PDE2_DICDI/30.36/3e-43,PDEase_I/PF00233.14/3.5e-55 TRINITY_DN8546_c0_g1_i1:135-1244(+)